MEKLPYNVMGFYVPPNPRKGEEQGRFFVGANYLNPVLVNQ